MKKRNSVHVSKEIVQLPTYEPAAPGRHPMFLERRVYQGSSGKVYPIPFTDRIAEEPVPRDWEAVHLENEFVRLMMLPGIGGRIHIGQDKTNGYDFFYRQNVIKPALVGLAGPWISGGVEFNWPQHHRPATFMPVETHIERHADGSVTVWFSDHDPMARMKGMHGVCLHPGRAVVEVKVRAYNRTPHVQTFLWWANVGARVHEAYQSFFPPDVSHVADHAKRATSTFPCCDGSYYGIEYGRRVKNGTPPEEQPPCFVPPGTYPPNDLAWYANIPVPTSYMAMGSQEDFFGGYDHLREAGLVHIANHHISPGKKQWTWGNHPFGYAWDRNLTDEDGPYIELMAGVYTDNQPDFSFLMPGETKTWSQYWYPIRQTGPVQSANLDAALRFTVKGNRADIRVSVTRSFRNAEIELTGPNGKQLSWKADLAPGKPFGTQTILKGRRDPTHWRVAVKDADGRLVISYQPQPMADSTLPGPATEPPPPREISSADELYVTGLHLAQYRHATRNPEDYWQEALRRDPGDARCNTALGARCIQRGEFSKAEDYFQRAIARLTRRNPNPYEGEAYYQLGLALRHMGRDGEAYAAFYKSVWNQAWQSAGYHALAEIDASRGDYCNALSHLEYSLRYNTDNLRARCLRAMIHAKTGDDAAARRQIRDNLRLDPLDAWSRWLRNPTEPVDPQTRIDVAIDLLRTGFLREAADCLAGTEKRSKDGSAPMIRYYQAYTARRLGQDKAAQRFLQQAAKADPIYCFPSRIEDLQVLENALVHHPDDARAAYYLGTLLYDRRRYADAMSYWERAVKGEPSNATAWRNLGIAYYNVRGDEQQAKRAYDKAFRAAPEDARILYERDQLWRRLRVEPARRLRELRRHVALVTQRDDLTIEYCALLNQTGRSKEALAIIEGRRFQPWEGGEGMALGAHERTHLLLAHAAMRDGKGADAVRHVEAALTVPEHLGEGRHVLANTSRLYLALGDALQSSGRTKEARAAWQKAATQRGDFQEMSVRSISDQTFFSARAMERLGRKRAAKGLYQRIVEYARDLEMTPAKIDYFATSLPTLLLFNEDLQDRQNLQARFLQAQGRLGLGQRSRAKTLLQQVLTRDPAHPLAGDLMNAD